MYVNLGVKIYLKLEYTHCTLFSHSLKSTTLVVRNANIRQGDSLWSLPYLHVRIRGTGTEHM